MVAVWLLTRTLDAPLAWESAAVCVALAAVLHAFAEWDPERAEAEGPAGAAVVSSVGFFVLLILAMDRANGTPWPWVAAAQSRVKQDQKDREQKCPHESAQLRE